MKIVVELLGVTIEVLVLAPEVFDGSGLGAFDFRVSFGALDAAPIRRTEENVIDDPDIITRKILVGCCGIGLNVRGNQKIVGRISPRHHVDALIDGRVFDEQTHGHDTSPLRQDVGEIVVGRIVHGPFDVTDRVVEFELSLHGSEVREYGEFFYLALKQHGRGLAIEAKGVEWAVRPIRLRATFTLYATGITEDRRFLGVPPGFDGLMEDEPVGLGLIVDDGRGLFGIVPRKHQECRAFDRDVGMPREKVRVDGGLQQVVVLVMVDKS